MTDSLLFLQSDLTYSTSARLPSSWFPSTNEKRQSDFRLALLRDWESDTPEKVIDFTRYDLTAQEPADPETGQHSRNWSLMNRLNQKGVRPQDVPIDIMELNPDEQAIIKRHYPELIKENK